MIDRPRIAVVGAGIGGLALAAALADAGTPCEVFEQTWRLAEMGAGVQLAPNAVRPLYRLGLEPVLRERAVRIDAMEIRSWTGAPISRTPLGAACEALFGAPYYAVHRAHLQEALRELVGPDRLRLGRRVRRVEPDDGCVTLVFDDGTTHRADVVVGADGIHSVVRDALVRDDPVFSGLGVFRGLVPVDRLSPAAREPVVRLWLGPGRHVVCYPVSGGELISFAATTPLREPSAESWSAAGDPAELVAAFDGWHGPVSEMTHAAGPIRRWALHDREPLRTWSTGRLTVLGDAAHPMLPFLAQGANQAIEDAMDLASYLTGAGLADMPALLADYQAVRESRTAAIQQGSRGNAEMMHLADGPRQRERDRAMNRSAGLGDRAWLYGYEAGRPYPVIDVDV